MMEKIDEFFVGQDFSKGFDLKLFLEYNHSINRFYPYGDYSNDINKNFGESEHQKRIEFAQQKDLKILDWQLFPGEAYGTNIGNGKTQVWREYSLGITYILDGEIKERYFHFQSDKSIK